MAFLGAGISHTAFGGVALGVLLDIDPFASSLVFCLLSAVLITRLSKQQAIGFDTGIGIFFSFAMALGSLFIALKKNYTFDLTGYLFGNILSVERIEIYWAFGALLFFSIFLIFYLQKLLFLSFDPEVAAVSGIRTIFLEYSLILFLALIIVTSIKSVGIILVSALVVLPASFGLALSQNYRNVMLLGVFFALVNMLSGLIVSNFWDIPTGASIVVIGTMVYFFTISLKALFGKI